MFRLRFWRRLLLPTASFILVALQASFVGTASATPGDLEVGLRPGVPASLHLEADPEPRGRPRALAFFLRRFEIGPCRTEAASPL